MQKSFTALSDTELLSILISSGTQDNSRLVLAQEALQLAKGNLSFQGVSKAFRYLCEKWYLMLKILEEI